MNYIAYVAAFFTLAGAIDYIIGNKLGIGKEFEKGINMIGILTLSMTGMLVIAPFISGLLQSVAGLLPGFIDPSIIPASLLANDMGGAPLSCQLARNSIIGGFNGYIVSSMMGCTISYTIPLALGMVEKTRHNDVLFGLLCGIITVPIGCFIGGIIVKVPFLPLIINLIPLIIFSIAIAVLLMKFTNACIKAFTILGNVIKIIIIAGLVSGIFRFLTGISLIPNTDTIENATLVTLNACCVMSGMFPFLNILSKILKKPLLFLGKSLNISDISVLGMFSALATNVTTFGMIKDMDRKGIVLNSAFAVSGSFVFAGHLAFTMAFDASYLPGMIIGKISAGIMAVVIALILYKTIYKEESQTSKEEVSI